MTGDRRLDGAWRRRAMMAAALLATSGLATMATPAIAQGEATAERSFAIAAQPLSDAIVLFSHQSGIQVTADAGLMAGRTASPVNGSLTPAAALSRLLMGTGLTYRFVGENAVRLEAAPQAADGAVQLGPVRVEGDGGAPATATATTAGEANPATTDGRHSYTSNYATVAGKTAVNVREIPNSVSIVTRQRMDDWNILTAQDAIKGVTGVTALSYSGTGDAHYYARGGFDLDAQYDGMPSASAELRGLVQFDLPMYDRLEVLKGPVGLLQGSTGYGGTINFVRKKPRSEFAASLNLQAGSWNFWHGDLDVTGPLNASGTIRGRVVASGTDRDFFYHTAYDRRWLGYGVLEFDLGPRTTLTVSAAHQGDSSIPTYGLPAYSDGRLPTDLSRSTFMGADWGRLKAPMTELYGEIRHDFGGDWEVRAAYTHRVSQYKGKQAYALGTVDPKTMLGSLYTTAQDQTYRWESADLYVSGPITLLGQTHNLLIGANYGSSDSRVLLSPGSFITGVSILDPHPVDPDLPVSGGNFSLTRQYGVYGQARIKLATPLTVVLGGRLSHFESKSRGELPVRTAWVEGAHVRSAFTPYAGVIFDVTRQVSLYASYADMFVPQTATTVSGDVLRPEKGRQFEAGVKGQFLHEALNASLAYFNIRDRNRAIQDETNPNFSVAQGEVENQGVEAEISGNLTANWEIVAGYAYTRSRYIRDPDNLGQPYDSRYPKHSFKLTSLYHFDRGALSGLRVGGNLLVQSAINSGTGAPVLRQGSYAVVDLQAGYQLTKRVSLSLNLNNAFDKRYFQRLGWTSFFNWYGAPRNVMGGLRFAF